MDERARSLLDELAQALNEDPRHVLEDVLRSALARHRRKENLAQNGHGQHDQTDQETVTIPRDLPDGMKWMRFSPITKLEDRLWLGGYADVREPEKLHELGITAIANVSDIDVIPSKEGFKCLFLDQRDQWLISDAVIDRFLRWMDQTWAEGHTILAHCIPPGTLINAPTPFLVEDGQVGMQVYDRDGNLQTITDTMRREYHGEMIVFDMAGNQPFRCTPEHPVLVIRPMRTPGGKVIKPNWAANGSTWMKKAAAVAPQWMKASEVEQGDFLLCPVSYASAATPMDVTANSHWNAKKIDTEPTPSPDLAWLFGLYVADGGVTGPNAFQLTLNGKTDRTRLQRAIRHLGVDFYFTDHGTYYRAGVNSVALTDTFRRWFGSDCYTKKIPEFLLGWPDELLQEFVNGLAEGDGQVDDRPYRTPGHTVVTTSYQLTYQLWMVLIRLGYYPYIAKYPDGAKTQFGVRAPTWRVTWTPAGRHHRTCRHAGYYCLPVTRVRSETYSGPVYNFSISGTESFLAGGIVTHNCHAGISRTIAFTIAWRIHRRGYRRIPDLALEWRQELDRIGAVRPVADPHRNLRLSVIRYFEQRITPP